MLPQMSALDQKRTLEPSNAMLITALVFALVLEDFLAKTRR
jgi:hypothetical protein